MAGTWMEFFALSFSLLSACTSSSVQVYEVAKLTFTHNYNGRIESFIGAFAPTVPQTDHSLGSWNITSIPLKIDVDNLNVPECKERVGYEVCSSPVRGAYKVVCDEEFNNLQSAIVDLCREDKGLELLILCVSQSKADELLQGGGLKVPETLTVVLVNRSDGLAQHACPLYHKNRNFNKTTNISVTVEYAGMGSIIPTTRSPPLYPFFDQTTTFYFVMFAFCLLLLLALVWFAFNYLKRCHSVLSRRQARQQLQTVTRKAVNNCPVRPYRKCKSSATDASEGEEDRCAICLEEYKAKELLRQLACKHEFHKTCVDPWLMDKRTCPLCKLDIVADYEGRSHTSPNSPTQEERQETPLEVVVELRAEGNEPRGSNDDVTAFAFTPNSTPDPDSEEASVVS